MCNLNGVGGLCLFVCLFVLVCLSSFLQNMVRLWPWLPTVHCDLVYSVPCKVMGVYNIILMTCIIFQ